MQPVFFWQDIISPHMALLADELAKRGVEVIFVANCEISVDREEQGWEVPSLRYAQLFLAPNATAVKKLVEDVPADSIHLCQGVRGNGLLRVILQQLRRRGLRQWGIVETVDDQVWYGVLKRIIYRALLWRQSKYLDGILAIGGTTSDWIVRLGFPSARIFPFAYFLDKKDLVSSAPVPHVQLPCSRFQFIYVGQLIARKQVSALLLALGQVGRDDLELTIVGAGPLESELRKQAEQLLPERVRWLGQQPMSELPDLIAQADCLVLPSRHDGWGAVISEALMVGTPVVCSDACGASIAVRASGVGSVFPANHRPALIAALAEQAQRGKWPQDKRARLSAWATCLNTDSGAEYLQSIFEYSAQGGERPKFPCWGSGGK